MNLRIIFIGLMLLLAPLAAVQAHEAHRNNEPEPTAQVDDSEKMSPVSTKKPGAGQSGHMSPENMPDQHAEHAHGSSIATGFDLTDFLGRLHPAAVHFPIALFLVAGLAELILIFRPSAGVGSSVRFLVWTGAAGGVLAAILGWFAGGFRLSDRSEILGLHRWTGTGVAVVGLVLAFLAGSATGSRKRTVFRVLLALMAVVILFQGYWGAEMSLGPDHMGLKKMGMMD